MCLVYLFVHMVFMWSMDITWSSSMLSTKGMKRPHTQNKHNKPSFNSCSVAIVNKTVAIIVEYLKKFCFVCALKN